MANLESNLGDKMITEVKHPSDCPWHNDYHRCDCELFQQIAYDEPNKDGLNNHVILTIEEAITRQIAHAALLGHSYSTQDDALADFMTLHWAYNV
mgnify:CR=1 FL=1